MSRPTMSPPRVPPEPPAGVLRGQPLSRLTTIRTGGPAEYFARAGDRPALAALMRWAAEARVSIAVVGSGSNLLIADEGVPGLVVKLDRELARIERDGPRIVCGGGARLPALAAFAARAGLSGIEFGVNIPGSVGGAVRMNANAYGGQWRALEWAEIVTAAGAERREPGELGLAYRRSALQDGEIVARACLTLEPADPDLLSGPPSRTCAPAGTRPSPRASGPSARPS